MRPVVFISHVNEDSDLAGRLKQWVDERLLGGVESFVSSDGSSIRGGEKWMEKIETALRAAKMVLVLCTQRSVERRWVFFEAGGAFFLGSRVIPLCTRGLTRNDLVPPLSFLQSYNLENPEHLTWLLSEIAQYAGLRAPNFDPAADVAWISTGSKINVRSVSDEGEDLYRPLTLKQAKNLAVQVNPGVTSSAERCLLAYEVTYDGQRTLGYLQKESWFAWHRHLLEKVRSAGFALPSAKEEGKSEIYNTATLLKRLIAENGWSTIDALLELESLLPEALPILVMEFLLLSHLEGHHHLGWWMQMELAKLMQPHANNLVVRAYATVLRSERVSFGSSLVRGLIENARMIIAEDSTFEAWFKNTAGRSFDEYRREGEEQERRWRQGRD